MFLQIPKGYSMKYFSEDKLILAALVLLTGAASANKADIFNTKPSAPASTIQNISYTANGTTDRRTALLFQQLMKNRHQLQISAEVIQSPKQQSRSPVDVTVNYTIHGKTSMKTVKRMIQLFKNNKEVQVIATANIKSNRTRNIQRSNLAQQRIPNNNPFPAPYQPFYYNGYPPVFIQGNTLWYPVPVNNQATFGNQVQNIPSQQPIVIAGQ